MPISPISRGNSGNLCPQGWQSVCSQMQSRIANYKKSGQIEWDQLSGYFSTMMAFAQGLGNVPFEQAMTNLYTALGGRGNWQKQLLAVENAFPSPPPSPSDMRNALYSALNSCSNPSLDDGGLGSYIQGFKEALGDLSCLASTQDRRILQSNDLQGAIEGLMASPDQAHLNAFKAALMRADQHW